MTHMTVSAGGRVECWKQHKTTHTDTYVLAGLGSLCVFVCVCERECVSVTILPKPKMNSKIEICKGEHPAKHNNNKIMV